MSTTHPAAEHPAVDDMQRVEEATHTMFDALARYLDAELASSASDYTVLTEVNAAATAKYAHMLEVTQGLAGHMEELKVQYAPLQPYLDQIDTIAATVAQLEVSVAALDDYSKRLAAKFAEREARLRKLAKQM